MAENSSLNDQKEQQNFKFVQEVSALILKHFRKGCLCNVESKTFAKLIAAAFEAINDVKDDADFAAASKTFLSFLSCLRKLVRTLVHVDNFEGEDEGSSHDGTLCKNYYDWILILVRVKFDLLSGLARLWPRTHRSSNLRQLTESTFNLILTFLPCPSRTTSGDSCRRSCQKIVENFIQLKSVNCDLGIGLIYNIFCHLEREIENVKKKSDVKIIFDCKSAHIRVKCNSRIHFHTIRQFTTNELKQHWRLWADRCLDDPEQETLRKVEILTLWKCLVSVTSNLGYSQSREFVSAASRLVSRTVSETNHLIKLKQLEVLNEVLCYGSTLGIQSTIPCEVSDLAQELLRQARTIPFSDYQIPVAFPGFGGNQIKFDPEDEYAPEEAPSLGVIQGLVLLHLKSSAIVVREAQCCSSSDSSASDSSLSSHGSSSIGDAEREMKMIERNVVSILSKLKMWIIEQLELHSTSRLSQCITVLFNEQDDAMIESLLCTLDIFTGLHFGAFSSKHFGVETETDSSNVLFEELDPLDGFESFLETISCDPSVILDFLLSNETCFLLYFLRLLKYLAKTSSTPSASAPGLLHLQPERSSVVQVLKKVHLSIQKLSRKSLFPYEISPVLKQLEKLVPINPGTRDVS